MQLSTIHPTPLSKDTFDYHHHKKIIMTALQPAFWQLQMYQHLQRFYPEWVRSIERRDTKCKGLYFYRHRPVLAEKEFHDTLQSSSIDHALESALQLLTCDLPEPVYPAVLKTLDVMEIQDLTDDAILNICDLIHNDFESPLPEHITPQVIEKYLSLKI